MRASGDYGQALLPATEMLRKELTHPDRPFDKVYHVSCLLLVQAADPEGDKSWTLADPRAYESLPEIMTSENDWVRFRIIMTDLMFLWRRLHSGNEVLCVFWLSKSWHSPLVA